MFIGVLIFWYIILNKFLLISGGSGGGGGGLRGVGWVVKIFCPAVLKKRSFGENSFLILSQYKQIFAS